MICDKRGFQIRTHGVWGYNRGCRCGTCSTEKSKWLADSRNGIFSQITIDPSGCLIWTGRLLFGYALASFDGDAWRLHRLMYEWFAGPIPDGLELDHLCHTNDTECGGGDICPHRRCVNPAHLEPVLHIENMSRRGAGVTHCPQKHPYNEENTSLKANGSRGCRPCIRAKSARDRAAKPVHGAKVHFPPAADNKAALCGSFTTASLYLSDEPEQVTCALCLKSPRRPTQIKGAAA